MDFLSAILWLSLNVYFEGRSEDKLSQIAIARATINRAKNKSIKETVFEPYAFSWTHQQHHYYPRDLKAYFESVHSAYVALQGADFLQGADHYHEKSIRPYWAYKLSYVGTVGSHKFYRPMIKLKAKRKVKYEKVFIVSRSGRHRQS